MGLERFFTDLWGISLEAGPYLALGFGIAAILHRYVKPEWMVGLLGKGKIRSTVTAAAVGVPLPLCSCSVVPTAIAIQKKGASRGATLAFLISTPETGVDSISITYGMMGPVMAVARPLAALFSAIGAGLLLEALPEKKHAEEPPKEPVKSCCASKTASESVSSCHTEPKEEASCCHAGGHAQEVQIEPRPHMEPVMGGFSAFRELQGLWRSFLMLFDDIAVWIAVGLILSALVGILLPADTLTSDLGRGWKGMALALVIGLPMYVCATASTPLALVLMQKGLSAGAALVFLLVGPATNIGTIGIVSKMLGKRGVVCYLISIITVAILFGMALDSFPGAIRLAEGFHSHEHGPLSGGILANLAAGTLWFVLLWRVGRKWIPERLANGTSPAGARLVEEAETAQGGSHTRCH
ncbi:MAG: SO_0444 family Cu/Zn efflux transporter [Candidatus Omnitrophica bacterium]|nr:hypothetical protein [bacterium]NUN96332.1 SO_0444 family Cu/Zn efflux transporter [Candidatus Omnitrophota bacterium]